MKFIAKPLIIFLLIALTKLSVATFEEPAMIGDVHFDIPLNWELLDTNSRRNITMIQNEQIATLNVYYRVVEETVTANGLQEKRATSHYDGWINVVSKPMPIEKVELANCDEGYVAVYVQQSLDENLQIQENLIAEYYFVKGFNTAVVTAYSNKSNWLSIKKDLEVFFNSFWMGEEEARPDIKEDISDLSSWHYQGNKQNQNYIEANPEIQQERQLNWEIVVSSNTKKKDFSYLVNQNNFYFLDNNHLYKVDSKTGKTIWQFKLKNPVKEDLAYHSNLIFITEKSPKESIKAISESSGEIVYELSFDNEIGQPTFLYHYLYVNEAGSVKCFDTHSGKLLWSKPNKYTVSTPLLASKLGIIAQQSDNSIQALDPENGELRWKLKHKALTNSALSNNHYLYLPTQKSKKDVELHCIDLQTGKKLWAFKQDNSNFKISESPTLSKEHLIVSATINNMPILLNIHPETGSLQWKKELSQHVHRTSITKQYLFSHAKESNDILIVDAFTGESIPIEIEHDESEKMIQLIVHNKQLYTVIQKDDLLIIRSFS